MINITLPDRSKKKFNKPFTGLDIAKSIIESYKGTIYLMDKTIKGYKGACFVVKLPIKEI